MTSSRTWGLFSRLGVAALTFAVLPACDGVTVPGDQTRVVVEGYLFVGRVPEIQLLMTLPVWDGTIKEGDAGRQPLSGAEVTLIGPDGPERLVEDATSGVYVGSRPVRPATRYEIRVAASGMPSVHAIVDAPSGSPGVTVVAALQDVEQRPVEGTPLFERTYRLQWNVHISAPGTPRYVAVRWYRTPPELWGRPAKTDLVRIAPGEADQVVFEESVAAIVSSSSAPDSYSGTDVQLWALVAEVDSVYYRRLSVDPVLAAGPLPSNVVGGGGILGAIHADTLTAVVTLPSMGESQ